MSTSGRLWCSTRTYTNARAGTLAVAPRISTPSIRSPWRSASSGSTNDAGSCCNVVRSRRASRSCGSTARHSAAACAGTLNTALNRASWGRVVILHGPGARRVPAQVSEITRPVVRARTPRGRIVRYPDRCWVSVELSTAGCVGFAGPPQGRCHARAANTMTSTISVSANVMAVPATATWTDGITTSHSGPGRVT